MSDKETKTARSIPQGVIELLEAALVYPESAEGYIRQVIEMLSADQWWCDLCEHAFCRECDTWCCKCGDGKVPVASSATPANGYKAATEPTTPQLTESEVNSIESVHSSPPDKTVLSLCRALRAAWADRNTWQQVAEVLDEEKTTLREQLAEAEKVLEGLGWARRNK